MRPFLMWPSPFSNRVQQVMFQIQQESMCTGVNMIDRVIEESRSAILPLPDAAQSDNADRSSEQTSSERRSTPIFYMLDGASLPCSYAYQIMSLADFDTEDKVIPHRHCSPSVSLTSFATGATVRQATAGAAQQGQGILHPVSVSGVSAGGAH